MNVTFSEVADDTVVSVDLGDGLVDLVVLQGVEGLDAGEMLSDGLLML